ncbi:fungal-specific transcription factor domain-containing protein [Hypoxylon trugodes]|uniref:fungal-specific transcription factor domain-containing protein n=1 Tax=Hypoxylon trugodes TaxID=326681 RepID=UPI00219A0FA3|nr:fungal-specific transcription factor domain-containing protein [Hypoxylon trugodes]KAI1391736.1 fungal-specific transcription factor domain-containing protein [Hypoxylon trugodes]
MRASGGTLRAAEAKRRARRVPEDQRKRGIQSCDLCRKKRCRCVPASEDTNRCTTCLGQGVDCTFTLPRKTRFYGNIEDLSDRFRCLEAIVKGAFPNEPTDSVENLMRLGKSKGYSMPDLSQDGSEVPIRIDEALRICQQSESSSDGGTSILTSANRSANLGARLEVNGITSQENIKPVEGTASLVSDTSGKEHYIGPSGGLQFLGQLRRLLISREQKPGIHYLAPPNAASRFTEDDGAQALEVEEAHDNPVDSRHLADDASIAATRDQRSPGSIVSLESDFIRKSTVGIDDLWKRLPEQGILEKLLQSFFQYVHEDFVLFHRGTFEGDYEIQTQKMRQNSSHPYDEKEPNIGLLACIYMMIAFGSMCDSTIGGNSFDHVGLRKHCVSSARSLLPHLISKCTLYNLRALLLLGLFLHNNNERNATWNLVGTATRLAFALGLHRKDTGFAFNPIEREIRKRIFCTLYGFEQFLATSLGRPSGMNDSDVEVIPPRAGILDGNGGGGDAALVTYTLRLHRILGRSRIIQGGIDTELRVAGTSKPLSPEATLLDLDEWKLDLSKQDWLNLPPIKTGQSIFDDKEPSAIAIDDLKSLLRWQSRSSLRAALMLHLQYHYIALFTTRPFLLQELSVGQASSQGQNHATSRQILLAGTCLRHAGQMAMIILLLDSFDLINGVSGLDIFYVYWASMVLSLGMLRRQTTSEDERVLVTLGDLVAQLRAVAVRAEKSGTMKRFTRLIGAFADYVTYRCKPPKAMNTNDGLETGGIGVDGGMEPSRMLPDSSQLATGAFAGSEVLDSFYWSNAMMPLGNTIEGGAGPDGFGNWAGDVGGTANGVDWISSLVGTDIEMPLDYGGIMRHE